MPHLCPALDTQPPAPEMLPDHWPGPHSAQGDDPPPLLMLVCSSLVL